MVQRLIRGNKLLVAMAKLIMVLVCFSCSVIADTTVIVYPFQRIGDGYPRELLQLALSKSEDKTPFVLKESDVRTTQGRSLLMISHGQGIDVAWSMTSKQREELLAAIKIPIYKGLYGYRLFLIHKTRQNRFPESMSFHELKNSRLAVQGVDWPDLRILEHNQFSVISAKHFSAMFELVSKQRVDYFPRSILEIWEEQKTFGKEALSVEKNLMLSYPTYVFYFVAKENKALAKRLRQGLLASINDGSFDSLFNRYKGAALENAKLKKRKVFQLENPNVNQDGVYQWPSLVEK